MVFCGMSAHDINVPSHSRACIRLLATTDLHGHLLPHDYIKDAPTQGGGLAGVARLIAEARAQAEASGMPVVLLDNGDTFQGTPLAMHLAQLPVDPHHPIVAAMNSLKYDALGLGNHDLDHGLSYLKAVAAALNMPILNSNLRNIDIRPLCNSLLLPIKLPPNAPAPLTLGILSVLPRQSMAWQSHHLGTQTSLAPPAEAVTEAAADLRNKGADLIVVLGHMGVGQADSTDDDISAAHGLAQTGVIDALVLGHTHRRLPSTDYATRKGVDFQKGTVGGVPAIMAGHAGSDLGVLDLALSYTPERGWQVDNHHAMLRPNGGNVLPMPQIASLATAMHKTVTCTLSEQVATTSSHLHSYFSLVSPAPTQALTALAQYRQVKEALRGGPYENTPVLSCAAAHGAGGRDGPGNYLDIPKGPVYRRHIAGLNPFANQTVGIHTTGMRLKHWLEHAALLFNDVTRQKASRMLVNSDIPAFQFDTIFGLHYIIDPGQPPFSRISALEYGGQPLRMDQSFILATNQFRAAGGGGYGKSPERTIACRLSTPLQDSMIEALNSMHAPPWGDTQPWRFAPLGGVEVIILTHPQALNCVSTIAHLKPKPMGTTPDGFVRLSITL